MDKRSIITFAVIILVTLFIFNAGLWGWGLFIIIFLWLGIRVFYYIIRSYNKHKENKAAFRREYVLKMTAMFMVLFFISGTIICSVALFLIDQDSSAQNNTELILRSTLEEPVAQNNTELVVRPMHGVSSAQINNTELILRSMLSSLDLFMLDVDSNILDRLDKHPFFKGILIFQATLSFLCTLTLIVSLIFSRAKAYYLLHRKARITKDKNHLYIFFDINENSKMLAKDIYEKDSRALIIFVDKANVKDDENHSLDNIVSLFTHRQKTFEIADESNALVAIASERLCDLDESLLEGKDIDVLSMIGLEKVKEFIEALEKIPDNPELHIFFLSNEEDVNIRSLINLAKDSTVLNCVKYRADKDNAPDKSNIKDSVSDNKVAEDSDEDEKKLKQQIYCHARYNGPNRVVEDLAVRKGLEVELIDSSHLAVELMKSKSSCQPVMVAHLSKEYPATVTQSLECLIVGFGEVGRDSFRFLYEFGTFVKIKDGKPEAARPHITAIDSEMTVIRGLFEANTPAINYDDGGIRLRELDYRSLPFYNECLSPARCKELNYIVIALGDDDQNINLAANIFNRIRRYREDMSHLIIMVRCIRDEKREFMQKIADHYNRGCNDRDLRSIRLFGNPEEIYSYNIIIHNDLIRKGSIFLENYSRLKGEEENWVTRHNELIEIAKVKSNEEYYPKIDKLGKLRRKESQDLANALHIVTKMWLLQKALGENHDWADFTGKIFDAKGNSTRSGVIKDIYYPLLTPEENSIMLNLAILEHFRWNAAHELLGYETNYDENQCNERIRKHNCLRDWNELEEESLKASQDYKSFDFCVVDTSIFIIGNRLGKMSETEDLVLEPGSDDKDESI